MFILKGSNLEKLEEIYYYNDSDWFVSFPPIKNNMVKTFAYVQNEVKESTNTIRVFISKSSYTLTEDIGYFRLLSFTLNALQGSIIETQKTPGKSSQTGKVITNYTEYMHLVEVPSDEKTTVESILAAGFKKA